MAAAKEEAAKKAEEELKAMQAELEKKKNDEALKKQVKDHEEALAKLRGELLESSSKLKVRNTDCCHLASSDVHDL